MPRQTFSRVIRVRYGSNLRREREQADLSQTRVAELAGLHRSAVSLLEAGKRAPTIEHTFRLGGALGIHPAELLVGMVAGPVTDEYLFTEADHA